MAGRPIASERLGEVEAHKPGDSANPQQKRAKAFGSSPQEFDALARAERTFQPAGHHFSFGVN